MLILVVNCRKYINLFKLLDNYDHYDEDIHLNQSLLLKLNT